MLIITVLFELLHFEDFFDESENYASDEPGDDPEYALTSSELSEYESVESPLSLNDDDDSDVDEEFSDGSSPLMFLTDSNVDQSFSFVSIVKVSSSSE